MKIPADIFISPRSTLRQAMEAIDRNSLQICFFVDDENKLVGVLTDGDIRRALLKGSSLEECVEKIMSLNPKFVRDGLARAEMLEKMRDWEVKHLPILDEKNQVIGIQTSDSLMSLHRRPNQVVLMAGGFGKRLSPLTDQIPKPLLNVGGQPILETIVKRFKDFGFHKFVLILNYRAEMIRNHFGDGSKMGVEIKYLLEDSPMGTCGGLSLLPEKPQHPIFVMNGDILTRADFAEMLDAHLAMESIATMAVREHVVEVPYGVVRLDGNKIISIEEKPRETSFVNAGIYILSPEALQSIPEGKSYDMPSLFTSLRNQECSVNSYLLREYWLDIGRLEDFHRAQNDFEGHFKG